MRQLSGTDSNCTNCPRRHESGILVLQPDDVAAAAGGGPMIRRPSRTGRAQIDHPRVVDQRLGDVRLHGGDGFDHGRFVLTLSRRAADDAGAMPGSDAVILDPQSTASSVYTLAVALGYIPGRARRSCGDHRFRHRTITPHCWQNRGARGCCGSKLLAVLPFSRRRPGRGSGDGVGAAILAVLGEPTFLAPADPAHHRVVGGGTGRLVPGRGSASARC